MREDGLDPSRSPLYVYVVSKILAEEAAWEFARAHPGLDLATGKVDQLLASHTFLSHPSQQIHLGFMALMYLGIASLDPKPLEVTATYTIFLQIRQKPFPWLLHHGS